jgi:PAS domain-containing protein
MEKKGAIRNQETTSFKNFITTCDPEILKQVVQETAESLVDCLSKGNNIKDIIIENSDKVDMIDFVINYKEKESTECLREIKEILKKEELEFEVLYENSPNMNISISLEGKILMVNKTLLHKLGYTKKEIIGKNIIDMYPERTLNEVKK